MKIPVKAPLALMSMHPAWCVFPIVLDLKSPPHFKNELELASNDPAVVKRWAKQWPGCNWGLALRKSHLIVLDVDTKPGKHGALTLSRLELIHRPLPHTFEVRTSSGGRHIYFHETNVVRHRMKVNAFGRDIDSTNYVVAPNSFTKYVAGKQAEGHYKITVNTPVAPAPDWMAEYLDAREGDDIDQAPAVEQDTPDIIAHAVHYLRKDAKPSIMGRNGEYTLLMVAAMLKDIGISEHKSVELLAEHYNPRCEPPWDIGEGAIEDRLDVKVRNAWAYLHQTQPGAHTAAADFGDDIPDIYETEADRRLAKQRTYTREDHYGMGKPMPWKPRQP